MYSISAFIEQTANVFSSIFFAMPAFAENPVVAGARAAQVKGLPTELFGATGVFTMLSNTLLFIVGALSVLMLVVGGLRYVISAGDATKVTAAKNTILYAIVGLIVVLLAYALIDFVLYSLMPGGRA